LETEDCKLEWKTSNSSYYESENDVRDIIRAVLKLRPYLDQTLCLTLTFTSLQHLKDSMPLSVITQYVESHIYVCFNPQLRFELAHPATTH